MPETADTPIYDSAKRGPIALEELRELWRYRHLIYQLVRRDIVSRYKRSVLGVAWTMLNPLGMMIVLTIVFSQVFGRGESYPAYLLSGLVAWNFFAQTTNVGMRQLIWGGGLMSRIYLPRTAFPVSAIGTGLLHLLLSLIPLFIVLMVTGVRIKLAVLFLPISILLIAAFSLGVSMLLSSFTVYFPDVAEMYQIVLRAWMFLTPIIYPESIYPDTYRFWILNLNPMYHLVKVFRHPVYAGELPQTNEVIIAVGIAIIMLLFGWLFYTREAEKIAY